MPGTRSAFAERAAGGYFVDLDLRRDEIARYGLSVAAVQDVVMSAIGGENVTTTVEGRARFPVNVRYPRDLRSDLETLGRVLVMTPSGAQVPLAQLADIRTVTGPSMIRNENGLLVGYVYVDITGRDVGGYVDDAKRAVAAAVKLPSGYALEWSGQYENMQRVTERLKLVVPFTLFLILFLLYANTKSLAKTLIVVLAVPFSVIGAVWLLWALDYNVSIAVWVGMIALMGLDAETGVFMLLFLDLAYAEAKAKGRLRSMADLHEAIVHGAVKRLRPKMMTVTAAMIGLMPIMWSIGTGADVMKRVAAPMVGGLATSFALELLVYPAIYLRIGSQVEAALRDVPGTRSAFAERAAGGYFVDLDLRRDEIARYGLSVAAVQDVVMSAIGGENVTTTVEGRARFPVSVRYPRDLRSDLETLGRVLVMTPSGAQVPLAQVADIRTVTGPSMIRNENGLLVGYVYVDITGRDVGGYVDDAKRAVAAAVKLPSGYALEWSGQYENMQRVTERLKLVVPFTLFLILFLLYANTKSLAKTLIVVLAVPFSVIGAVWLLWALDYNVSIAVWVGMIALMGLDAETGVFMLLFLDLAYDEAKAKGGLRSMADLHEAIVHGAVKRLRPKMMTVTAAMIGLMPIMWSIGTGADVMKRVAAPMVGGLATSFALELLVYPAIYLLWRWHTEVRHAAAAVPEA